MQSTRRLFFRYNTTTSLSFIAMAQAPPSDMQRLLEKTLSEMDTRTDAAQPDGKPLSLDALWDQIQADPSRAPEFARRQIAPLDQTYLIQAVSEGHTDIVQALLPHSEVKARNAMDLSALMYAASKGNLDMVRFLFPLSDGYARVGEDHIFHGGQNALDIAAEQGALDCVRFLTLQLPELSEEDIERAAVQAWFSEHMDCADWLYARLPLDLLTALSVRQEFTLPLSRLPLTQAVIERSQLEQAMPRKMPGEPASPSEESSTGTGPSTSPSWGRRL